MRKLIAFCDIKLLWRTPHSIGTNHTRGRRCRRFDRRGVGGAGTAVAAGTMCGITLLGKVGVIAGTELGILACVRRECVRFVSFNTRLAVGFGAFIMGGAFVIRPRVVVGGPSCS